MNNYISSFNTLSLSAIESDRLSAISLFSGGGGLDLGRSLAGFNFAYANDETQAYCNTLTYNFSECIAEAKDVNKGKGEEIKNYISLIPWDYAKISQLL